MGQKPDIRFFFPNLLTLSKTMNFFLTHSHHYIKYIFVGLLLLSIHSPQNLQASTEKNITLYYDDMALVIPEDKNPNPLQNFISNLQGPSSSPFQTYSASLAKLQPWEDGVLPIEFTKTISDKNKERFFETCRIWESVANVKCILGKYKNRSLKVGNWIDSACWSLWGMGTHFAFFKRRMNLTNGCWSHSTLLHELGHAFGLIHEHQRPDRDQYITILDKNASGEFLGLNIPINFGIQNAKLHTPYDFFSIMHYSRTAFSKNGQDTIVPKPSYSQYIDIMGRVVQISRGDAAALVNLYGPPKNP